VETRNHLQDGQGVVDKGGDELVERVGVVRGAGGLARVVVVVVRRQCQRLGLGHQPSDPADGRDELHDGVLGGDRVVEHGRVEHPAGLAGDHPGGVDDGPNRVEDPLGRLAGTQFAAPQGQHRRVEALVGERQPRGHLPDDVVPQLADRVAVREALQGLEHHDRGDDIGGHRGSAPARGKQVGEQLVGEQRPALLGQEGGHRAGRHQVPAQRSRVEELGVGIARALHPVRMKGSPQDREHDRNTNALVSDFFAKSSNCSAVP